MGEFLLQTLGLKSQALVDMKRLHGRKKEENSYTKALGYSQAKSLLYFDNSYNVLA